MRIVNSRLLDSILVSDENMSKVPSLEKLRSMRTHRKSGGCGRCGKSRVEANKLWYSFCSMIKTDDEVLSQIKAYLGTSRIAFRDITVPNKPLIHR